MWNKQSTNCECIWKIHCNAFDEFLPSWALKLKKKRLLSLSQHDLKFKAKGSVIQESWQEKTQQGCFLLSAFWLQLHRKVSTSRRSSVSSLFNPQTLVCLCQSALSSPGSSHIGGRPALIWMAASVQTLCATELNCVDSHTWTHRTHNTHTHTLLISAALRNQCGS